MKLAELHKKEKELNASKIDLSLLYSMRGSYLEAEKLLQSIQSSSLDKELRYEYYSAYHQFWEYYSISSRGNDYAKQQFALYWISPACLINCCKLTYWQVKNSLQKQKNNF